MFSTQGENMIFGDKYLQKYIDHCGNRYAAIRYVAKKARNLAEKYENVISHAEALTWVLTNEAPNNILSYYYRMLELREQGSLSAAKEQIAHILDKNVKNSVIESLRRSIQAGYLIYHYEEVYDSDRKARVRILTNMLWDKIQIDTKFE